MDLNKPSATDPNETATGPEATTDGQDVQEDLRWTAATHLSVLIGLVGIPGLLGPLVLWLIKKGESDFFDAQAKEALNFSLSVSIYSVALVAFIVIVAINESTAGIIFFSLALVAVLITSLILPIVAGVRAANGGTYRYPLTIRLVK